MRQSMSKPSLAERMRETAQSISNYAPREADGTPCEPWAQWTSDLLALADKVGALEQREAAREGGMNTGAMDRQENRALRACIKALEATNG